MVQTALDEIGLEAQTEYCEKWAELRAPGHRLEWLEDVDRSGREEKNRPGWQALLAQLDRPDVAGVVAYSLSRMYRNLSQFLAFLDRCERYQKQIMTVKETIDTTSAMGRAMVSILMLIYQLESDQTSERMREGIQFRREKLGRHWGPLPFGLERNASRVLVPTTAGYLYNPATGEALAFSPESPPGFETRRYIEALRAVYDQYADSDSSFLGTARLCNAAGWRYYADSSHAPRLFDSEAIRRIVSFWQLYRGELPTGKMQRSGPAATVLGGAHEPILPIELCDRVGYVRAALRFAGDEATPENQKLMVNSIFARLEVAKNVIAHYQPLPWARLLFG